MTTDSWLFLAALIAAWWLMRKTRQPRSATGHMHGGTRKLMARHEAGHVVAARALGATVKSATIEGSQPGVSWSGSRGKTTEQIASDVIMFMHAGEAAAGTGRGCSADREAKREQLKYLPAKDRARVRRAAEAKANRIVASNAGEIQRIAKRLDANGRL